MPTTTVFYSRYSRAIAVVVALGCIAAATAVTVSGSFEELARTLPTLFLFGFLGWALFWQPVVLVDDDRVVLRNVYRSIRIPWPAITTVDTRWALAIGTASGSYSAWAAPSAGRHGLYRITTAENKRLARSAYYGGTIRTGDALSSDSGQAAQIVRSRWEYLRDRDLLEDGPDSSATVRWHWVTIGISALALTAAVVSLST